MPANRRDAACTTLRRWRDIDLRLIEALRDDRGCTKRFLDCAVLAAAEAGAALAPVCHTASPVRQHYPA